MSQSKQSPTSPPQPQSAPAAPPADLSPRIIPLARKIDHLSPGTYVITLEKRPAPQAWNVNILQVVDNSAK
jgi:hypothetical protein